MVAPSSAASHPSSLQQAKQDNDGSHGSSELIKGTLLMHSLDHKRILANALELASVAVVAQDLYGKMYAVVSLVDRIIVQKGPSALGRRNTPKRRHHWTWSVLISVARMAAWFVILYRNTRFGDAVDVAIQLCKLVIAALRGPPAGAVGSGNGGVGDFTLDSHSTHDTL